MTSLWWVFNTHHASVVSLNSWRYCAGLQPSFLWWAFGSGWYVAGPLALCVVVGFEVPSILRLRTDIRPSVGYATRMTQDIRHLWDRL